MERVEASLSGTWAEQNGNGMQWDVRGIRSGRGMGLVALVTPHPITPPEPFPPNMRLVGLKLLA